MIRTRNVYVKKHMLSLCSAYVGPRMVCSFAGMTSPKRNTLFLGHVGALEVLFGVILEAMSGQ